MGLFGSIGSLAGSIIGGPMGTAIGGTAGGFLDSEFNGNSIEDRLRGARKRMLGMSEASSKKAESLLRESYADAFRLRASGVDAALASESRSFADQASAQGLNRTIGANMLAERRAQAQMGLAEAAAGSGAELNSDLAKLAKNTGTEQLGIESNFQTQMLNYQISKNAQQDQLSSGLMGALGSIGAAKMGQPGQTSTEPNMPNGTAMKWNEQTGRWE